MTYAQIRGLVASDDPLELLAAAAATLTGGDGHTPRDYEPERQHALTLYSCAYYNWLAGKRTSQPKTESFSVYEDQAAAMRALAVELDQRQG